MTLWKVYCEENKFPGMWQRWFQNQCVAVGWSSKKGYRLNGASKASPGWERARKAIKKINIGDQIVVALRNNHVGRLGTVTEKRIEDDQWNPLVPVSPRQPYGEMGRRILVRWELTIGPDSRDMIVSLPPAARLSSGELQSTITRVRSQSSRKLQQVMNDPVNWVGLLTHFRYEQALSGYIAAYPHKLEDGLLPHPDERVREKVFKDRTRSDVILEDRNRNPVIVECKQHGPTLGDLEQLRRYMQRLKEQTGKMSRGILVHGGARKLPVEVAVAARKSPKVEIVKYSLDVDFSKSG